MRILLINPNSTASMTTAIGEAARDVAAPGTTITAMNPVNAPASIQGPEDGAAALPGLYELFDAEILKSGTYDAAIIACFDDTGLDELKSRTALPVLGIGEAAYHAAMLITPRFSVVTTLAVSIPVLEENLKTYGFASRCARVRASDVPVLDLEDGGEAVRRQIANEITLALAEDGAGAIVLGCAGMADLAGDLSRQFGVPVIDGVAAAVAFAEALGRVNICSGGGRLAS